MEEGGKKYNTGAKRETFIIYQNMNSGLRLVTSQISDLSLNVITSAQCLCNLKHVHNQHLLALIKISLYPLNEGKSSVTRSFLATHLHSAILSLKSLSLGGGR